VGECFFWYRPTRVVPDQGPLNGCVFCLISVSIKQRFVNSLASSYSIRSLHDSRSAIKQCVWKHNVMSAINSGHLSLS